MGGPRRSVYYIGQEISGFKILKFNSPSTCNCVCLNCGQLHYDKSTTNLRVKKRKFCSCVGRHNQSLVGRVFGKLTILANLGSKSPEATIANTIWLCTCACGGEISVLGQYLVTGMVQTCSCETKLIFKYIKVCNTNTIHRSRVPGYDQWRLSVFSAGNSVCTIPRCGETSELEAHHIILWKDLIHRPRIRMLPSVGTILCKGCHKDYHRLCGIKETGYTQMLAYQSLHNTVENFRNLSKKERKQLMEIKEKEVLDLFNRALQLEEDKKAISDEIKESIESFAASHDLEPEALVEGLKKYKKYLKDPAKFLLVDFAIDAVLNSFVKEYQTEIVPEVV